MTEATDPLLAQRTATAAPAGRSWQELATGKLLPWISTPIVVVLCWFGWKAAIALFNISPFVLPQPEKVVTAMWDIVQEDGFWHHVSATLQATFAGFAIALVFGLVMGVILGRIAWLERALRPVIVASQVVPKVALVPLFILWFGFGVTSKIVIAALLAFFPIMLNVILGVRSVDPGHKDVMRSLNAGRWATFRHLDYHSTLPYVLAGMEIGIVFAIIGAILGEYLGGDQGLGFLIVRELNGLDPQSLFAVVGVLTIIGFALFLAVVGLKRLLIPWHESVIETNQVTS